MSCNLIYNAKSCKYYLLSLLILDESTSGLDLVSEAKVLHNLISHHQEKTTILISHRPSVVQLADWIVMLENGHLSIQGTPADLRQQAGVHLSFIAGVKELELEERDKLNNIKIAIFINDPTIAITLLTVSQKNYISKWL